jgi:hypothetical protein
MKLLTTILLTFALILGCSPFPKKSTEQKRAEKIKRETQRKLAQYNQLREELKEAGAVKHQVDTVTQWKEIYLRKDSIIYRYITLHDTVQDARRVDSLLTVIDEAMAKGRELILDPGKGLSQNAHDLARAGMLKLLRENPQFRDTTITQGRISVHIDKNGDIKIIEAAQQITYKESTIVHTWLPWSPETGFSKDIKTWFWWLLLLVLLLLWFVYKLLTRNR